MRLRMGSISHSNDCTDAVLYEVTLRLRPCPLTTAKQWLRDRSLALADIRTKRSRRKKAVVPEG